MHKKARLHPSKFRQSPVRATCTDPCLSAFYDLSCRESKCACVLTPLRCKTKTRKVQVYDREGNKKFDAEGRPVLISVQTEIWNPAVANLTLMALGSSTPEIMRELPTIHACRGRNYVQDSFLSWQSCVCLCALTQIVAVSIIEICGANFYSGELGPGTVVGSAAFNLFIISALCISALPEGEGRKIDNLQVFGLTSIHSLIAYCESLRFLSPLSCYSSTRISISCHLMLSCCVLRTLL